MKVNNRKIIRHISFQSLKASKKRNVIAILAISLTTILFITLFTMSMSIISTYETAQFKSAGGYAHGTFKEVNDEKILAISNHKLIKETGERIVVGGLESGKFKNTFAEVSFMDDHCAKWSYAIPSEGRLPKKVNEIAMDTKALSLLGAEKKIGATVSLPYKVFDKNQNGPEVEETFILSGYWEYDAALPVHYINVSRAYVEDLEQRLTANHLDEFRRDLNVMLASSVNIEGKMQQIDQDLGYDWTTWNNDNSVRIGVNWGYTASQLDHGLDAEGVLAIFGLACLIIFSGYLIIYNIFQISVVNDIRFYGLLKTIGVTPRQLKRMIRNQAFMLCLIAIPIGLGIGYMIGSLLVPVILSNTNFDTQSFSVSTSPFIFVFSISFSLLTVWISSAKPGKMAGKVSPVEATKYTEMTTSKKKEKKYQGAKVYQMAFANLGRNQRKTSLVVISLALSVVLLNLLVSFVNGFDKEKYEKYFASSDFLIADQSYFGTHNFTIDPVQGEEMEQIKSQFTTSWSGSGYESTHIVTEWMTLEQWKTQMSCFYSEEELARYQEQIELVDGYTRRMTLIEGFDESMFSRLTLVEGDIQALFDEKNHYIAVEVDTDDYGNIHEKERLPQIGDQIKISYAEDIQYIDLLTQEPITEDTLPQNMKEKYLNEKDVVYTVVAKVIIPKSIGMRHSLGGNIFVLPKEVLARDGNAPVKELFYAFDVPDEKTQMETESFLANLTAPEESNVKYESKESIRKDFMQFKSMFTIVGGLLCGILALIGTLNFINAIMTGMIARRKEFAVLQAVGMTNRQLRQMLIDEGLGYTVGAGVLAAILSLVLQTFTGHLLETMFWFYTSRFTFWPVLVMIPVFAFLGFVVPHILYGEMRKESVVERLAVS